MTPAVKFAKQHKLDYQIHEYHHERSSESYGLEAVEKLNLPPEQVFKTLVVSDEKGNLAVAVLPVTNTLNLKKMANALSVKKVTMAEPKIVERSTGYILGGVSPLKQKKKLPTVIDVSAQILPRMYVSAGRRGLEISLPPMQLVHILQAKLITIIS